jgi:hypothetical protein
MKKSIIKAWLRYFINQPLHKHYNIMINWEAFSDTEVMENDCPIESMEPESEVLSAGQHAMLWNEDQCLKSAPDQHATLINIIYDSYAESFPFMRYTKVCISNSVLTCI